MTEPIPLWFAASYTAFTAVLVAYYWREFGPTNFVFFCDVALFLGVASIWTGDPLWASMAAVGVLVPQLVWQIDFIGGLLKHPPLGMTAYMFDSGISRFARTLSFFHFWLPLALLFIVGRLGYDPRALSAWTVTAWGLMLVAYFCLPPPDVPKTFPGQPQNVNYVYGPSGERRQTWMPSGWYLVGLMIVLPVTCYLPAHALLRRWAG